jgi:hypothetical protein
MNMKLEKWRKRLKKQKNNKNTKLPKKANIKKIFQNRAYGGPVIRARAKELEKDNGVKILYANAVKNSHQDSSTQNGAQKLGAKNFHPKCKHTAWCTKCDYTNPN